MNELAYVLIRVDNDPELRDHYYEVRDADVVERIVFVSAQGVLSWDDRAAYDARDRPPSLVHGEWEGPDTYADMPNTDWTEITGDAFERVMSEARTKGERFWS